MRILHVIAGLPSAGGMSELVPLLALEQRRLGHEVTVATVGPADAPTACAAERGGVRFVCYQACGPRFLYYSLEMQGQLRTLTKNADLVHVHGCWTFPVWWGCHLALKYHKPYVRSPHGCLDRERLKLSAWKKRLAGLFFERRYFERATVIHATAESEAEGIGEYLRSSFVHYCGSALVGKHEDEERSSKVLKYESFKVGEGGAVGKPQSAGSAILPISQPATPLSLHSNFRMKGRAYPRIVVVPNGVDSQAFNGRPAKAALDRRWPECAGKRVVLFLSRLHPIKGIDLLLLAWARVLNRPLAVGNGYASSLTPHPTPFDNWHLLIAGPDENGYAVSVKNRCLDDKTDSRVTFCGPLYGEDKYGVMATADLFVLPTRNENFGIVVAEALACGVPVITTKGAPWQELLGSPASSKVRECVSALQTNNVNK
jgi:glycosyltransferase involved in cell wall biosynthesis